MNRGLKIHGDNSNFKARLDKIFNLKETIDFLNSLDDGPKRKERDDLVMSLLYNTTVNLDELAGVLQRYLNLIEMQRMGV
jgi:hypothetical protein